MQRAGLFTMLWRGMRRRCPRCDGKGAFFTSWFDKADACRTCGLRWRRGDVGFELGAVSMAAMIVLGAVITAMTGALALTWPEIAVVPTLVVLFTVGLVLPPIVYPVSYTMWQAIDLLMRPVEPEHFELDHLMFDVPDSSIGADLPPDAGSEHDTAE